MTGSQKNELLPASDKEETAKGERIQITDLSLPKGGGSFLGLKTDFKLDVQKGTSSLDIPFALPAGRNREEKLILSYHSTGGNGVFGQGFSLSLPVIERKTDCRIPVYLDDTDNFISSEFGDLKMTDTQTDPQGRKTINFVPTVEKEFPDIKLIKENGTSFWSVLTKDGTRHRFGAGRNSLVSDPDRRDHILRWKLSDTEDVKGNKTIYEYGESGETREISKLRYSNYSDESGEEKYAYEIEFSYKEGRTDPFVNYRGGFCLKTEKLCEKTVLYRNVPNRSPIREYCFQYGTQTGISLLTGITTRGITEDSKGGFTSKELPPLTFSYSGKEEFNPDYKRLQGGIHTIPGTLSKGVYQFTDLYGEGISGILYHDDKTAMYYEPLGPGIYSDPKSLKEFPMEGGAGEPSCRLISLKGNGLYDMVVSLPGRQGFYEQKDGGFAPFTPFKKGLNADCREYVELTDLQGDHLSHAAVAGVKNLTYYPSMKTDGFMPPVTLETPEGFPAREQEKRHRMVCFLDLFGDGLKHRVLVESGRVECYPSLGYGHFGGKLVMEHAPVFGGQFDANRLFFADLNGSGTMDFIYIYSDYAEVFINCCGKYFMEGRRLALPERYTEHDSVYFADMGGTGYQSMVFTKMGEEIRHYWCDLHGGTKPYLLEKTDNHMGAVTEITYESSALLCLKDKVKGLPWKTRTPFPIPVVKSVRTEDSVSTRITQAEYHYRDSFYDYAKRRFRGFGFVECVESNTYAGMGIGSQPKRTKTWYHNGTRPLTDRKDFYQKGSKNQRADMMPKNRALRTEAYRALEGKIIREELYSLDGTDREREAVTVLDHTYRVSSRKDGSHYAGLLSSLACEYEQTTDDPKIIQTEILETDEFENITRQARIYYGRGPGALTGQEKTEIELTLTSWHNRGDGGRLIGIKLEEKKLQLTCAEQSLSLELLMRKINSALTGQMTPDTVRLFSWEKHLYWNEEQTKALAPGCVTSPPLLHHTCRAVLGVNDLETIYEGPQNPELWITKYGYSLEDNMLWNRGVVNYYWGKERYFLLKKQENSFAEEMDPLFSRVEWEYDPYCLIPVHIGEYVEKDCMNHMYAKPDYAHLKYSEITDRNGNLTRAAWDPLGNISSVSYPERGIGGNPTPAVLYRYDYAAPMQNRGPVSCTEQRSETHQGTGGQMCRVTYFDGAGNPVERRKRFEDVWQVYEKKIKNSGGLDVISYLPYETAEEFKSFPDMGNTEAVNPILIRYDVKGRIIRVDTPREVLPGRLETAYLYTRIQYTPWSETHFNHHDTLRDSDYLRAVAALPDDDPEAVTVREVLQKSLLTVSKPRRYEKNVFGNICLEVLTKEPAEAGSSGCEAVAAFWKSDIQGRPVAAADPRLRKEKACNLKLHYDFQGNILRSDSADAGTVRRIYDCRQQVRYEEDSNQNKKSFEYDRLGRLTKKYVEGIGLTERIEYGEIVAGGELANLRGHICRQFDQAGVENSDMYDRFGRVIKKNRRFFKDCGGHIDWEAKASPEDRLDEAWDEEFAYNMFGGQILYIAPDGTGYITEYNEAGQPKSLRGIRKGQETVYITQKCYDASGLPKSVRYGNGVVTEYQFLKGGKELYRQHTAGEDGTRLQELRHYFDEMGNLSRMVNRLGSPVLEGAKETPRVFDYAYDGFGRLLSSTGWERSGRAASDSGVTDLHMLEPYREEYQYDWGNNLTALKHIAPSCSYTDRLTIREGSNRLLCVSDREISYDGSGNQLSTLDGCIAFWNWDNRLIRTESEGVECGGEHTLSRLSGNESNQELYVYDHSGKRTRKLRSEVLCGADGKKSLTITEKHYLGNYELKTVRRILGDKEELTFCESCVNLSLGGSLSLIATSDRIGGRDRLRYLIENHGGSVCMELDENGSVNTYEEYTSFGRTAFTAGGEEERGRKEYRFGGKEKDGNGLYYFGTRYYDHSRFLSCDNLAFIKFPEWMSLNLYTYCKNNPEKYTDATGEEPGRHFKSIDEAALNFAIEFNDRSIMGNRELGAFLYSATDHGKTYYSYHTPFTDCSIDSVNPGLISREKKVPGTIEGILHTHGAYSSQYNSENFSVADTTYADGLTAKYTHNIPIYVATPGGTLKKYDPSLPAATAVTTLSTKVPHDPKAMAHGHSSCNLCVAK